MVCYEECDRYRLVGTGLVDDGFVVELVSVRD